MASPETNLRVRITGDLADIKSGLALLQRDLQGVKRAAQTSLGQNNAFVDGLRRARQEIGGIVAGLVSIQGLRTFARLSDQAATLRGRLRLATSTQEEFNRAQRDTFDIAQRNQVSLETTVDLYGRLSRSTRALGLSQATQSALTETILQAGRLSFASEGGLDAAIVQLGQGLASGRLGGEELNSVLEQTPRLAQAIQDGLIELGVEGAENLRKLAKEGALTPKLIVDALLTQQQKIKAEAAKLPDTIAGQFTRISNALLKFIGDSNQANSAARTIITFLKAIGENLPTLIALMVTAAKVTAAYFLVFRAAPAAIGLATGALKLYRDQVIAASLAQTLGIKSTVTWTSRILAVLRGFAGVAFSIFAGWEIGKMLREQFIEVEIAGLALVSGLLQAFERLKGGLTIAWEGIKAVILGAINIIRNHMADSLDRLASAAETVDVFGLNAGAIARAREYASAVRAGGSAWDDFRAAATSAAREAEANAAAIDQTFLELAEAATLARQASEEAAGGSGAADGSGGGGGGAAKAAADNLALVIDAVERALRELERLYAAGELGAREYFAKKAQLETEAIDLAIRQAQEELRVADTADAQARALTEIIKLQRDRAEVGPRVAREQAAAEREWAEELREVSARLLELQGNTEAAAVVRLGAQFEALRQKARQFAGDAGVEIVDRLFNAELLNVRIQGFQSRMQSALAQLRISETSIAAQSEAGGLGPTESERQLQEVRGRSLTQLRQLRAEILANNAAMKDPEVLHFLQELDGNIAQIVASQQRFRQDLQDSAIDSLSDSLFNLVTGAKSGKEAWRDFVQGFAEGLARMASEALATFAILKLFDSIIPGFSQFMTSMRGGVFHGGGIAGAGGAIRNGLSPMLFGAAPRYHLGGIAGLAPNEVPIVAEKGEEILTESDPRHRRNLGKSAQGGNVYLTVENNGGAPARVEETRNANGDTSVKVIIDAVVSEVDRRIGSMGTTGRAIGSRFGLSPAGAPPRG